MSLLLPPLRLTGGIALRDGQLQRRSVALAQGRLTRGPLPEVALDGHLILPGCVDLAAPGVTGPLPQSVAAWAEASAAAGVTTACLTQRWGWEGGLNGPARALALIAALADLRAPADLRLCLLAETRHTADPARLIAAAAGRGVGYVAFTDSLDLLVEMARIDPVGFVAHAETIGQTSAALMAAMQAARDQVRAVPRYLCTLAEAFDDLGLPYGSHRDPDAETRERFSMIGARLALHPAARRAAMAALAMGSPVLMPTVAAPAAAPAAMALTQGETGLAEAAFALADRGHLPLARAWALVSEGPADVLRLADRGRIAPGLRADLVIVDAATRRIEATIAAGHLTHASGAAGRALAATLPGPARIAAE